jgi:internalin A
MKELTYLNISSTEIDNIEELKYLDKLEIFYADFCSFTDLKPLSYLINLKEIDITCSLANINDITPLSNLNKLEKLYLSNNRIKTIKPIFNLKNLKLLGIKNTDINIEELDYFKLINPYCEILV